MKHASYLRHLRFDKKLGGSLQAKYLSNPRLLVLILLMIISFGAFSYTNLPRRLNPEIKIPLVIVSTVLPGANPSDMESLVTDPLEDSLGSVPSIKTYSSTSRDSLSLIQIEFSSGVDADKATSDVKSATGNVKLPEDALSSDVRKIDFEQFPVWSFSVTSKSEDTASLIQFSKELRDRIEEVTTVDNVVISGLEEQEIQIVLKPEAVSTYSFSPQLLIPAITNATKSLPAGSVKTEGLSFTLSIDPTISDIDDIRSIKLPLQGDIVNLSDIATISLRSKPSQAQAYVSKKDFPARQTVSFSIYKTENADISKTVKDARIEVEGALSDYNSEFVVFTTSDISKEIDKQFQELTRDFAVTIALVFIALFLFLGIRQAVVASFSIPLTFLITFGIMNLLGVALSFISFFSLLLALGLVVDDTIVVISAMTSYYRSGKFTPFQTALLVWWDFIVPITTTTLTTVWAFIPLLLSAGIIGEFIKPIPIVVSTTLLASFAVAMFITLPIVTFLFRPSVPRRVKFLLLSLGFIGVIVFLLILSGGPKLIIPELLIFLSILFVVYNSRDLFIKKIRKQKFLKNTRQYLIHGVLSFETLSIRYQLFIRRILRSKRWTRLAVVFVIAFSIFSYALVPTGLVKSEFFPKVDSDQISVSIELPSGTNIQAAKNEALSIVERLRREKDVEAVSLGLGQSTDEFSGPASASPNNILFVLVLSEDRKKDSSQVAEKIRREFLSYSKGKFSVVEQSGGPPAGADIQIKLLGSDLLVLDRYANKAVAYLEKKPGVTNVDKSIKPGTSKISFIPDRQKLSENGLTVEQVGLTLRTFASGFEIDSVALDGSQNEERDITLRFSSEDHFVEEIGSLSIPTLSGNVPVLTLGTLKLSSSPTLITREDGKRTVSVTASATGGISIPEVNKDLESFANSLQLPTGYSWKTGGVNEENQESVSSILIAMILSFLLILVTMVLQFSSFRKALIVLLVIPLSISGVFVIFGLTNTSLSFPALIGVLALFGIVVKNSILIVDKIQANQRTKMSFEEAIAEGAASRLEPIALTSLSAILGLLPITLSDPLWRGLGGAIISGLTFSGTIMLFFIPVVYYLIFKPRGRSR